METFNKKIAIKLILFLLLGTIISAGLVLFFGPPFGRSVAEKEIDEYINIMYRDKAILRFVDYNLISNGHVGIITLGLEETRVDYNYYDHVIIDERIGYLMYPKFNKELEKFKQELSKDIEFVGSGNLFTKVDSNFDYTDDVSKMKLKSEIMVQLRNHNTKQTESQSKEVFISTTENLIKGFDASFNINRIEMNYTDIYGVYELNVKSKNTNELLKQIRKNVKKLSNDELALEEVEFINELKKSKRMRNQ